MTYRPVMQVHSKFYWSMVTVLLLLPVALAMAGGPINEYDDQTKARVICDKFFAGMKVSAPDCDAPLRGQNYSSDRSYVEKSSDLIKKTLGVDFEFRKFDHVAFSIECSERVVTGNMFAFDFGNLEQIKTVMAAIPSGEGGTYGTLKTKSPQRYALRQIGTVLGVLVIDGFRQDATVNGLFDHFRHMKP